MPRVQETSGLRAAFAEFDEESSEFISAAQLVKILTRPGEAQMSLDEANEIISQFDQNGDGRLSLDEFVVAWSNLEDDADDDSLIDAIKAHRKEATTPASQGCALSYDGAAAMLDMLARPGITQQWSTHELESLLDKLIAAQGRLSITLQARAK